MIASLDGDGNRLKRLRLPERHGRLDRRTRCRVGGKASLTDFARFNRCGDDTIFASLGLEVNGDRMFHVNERMGVGDGNGR